MKKEHKSPVTKRGKALRNGKTTAVRMLMKTYGRIAAIDREGPALNAVLEMNPQAEGIARVRDAELRAGIDRGPLHGIPVLVKDNIDTGDMMHTSAGSLALAGRYAPRDAFIAHRLREAGAVLVGKTNMTEFANFMADVMPSGYSSRGGQVKHPWGDFDPSGSSTGSAVAVAAGYVPVAIGTETFGSIISPASECGVVGVKPTVGLVSRSGILPISISQDTAGPMGRSVLDCAMALDAIAGPDANDPYTLHGKPTGGYARAVEYAPARLDGIRLGLDNRLHDGGAVENDAFLGALEQIKALGAEIVAVKQPEYPGELVWQTMRNEFRICMDHALRGSSGCPLTLAEIVAYNIRHGDTCLRYGQDVLEACLREGTGVENPAYLQARAGIRKTFVAELKRLHRKNGVAAVITPSCSLYAVAGYPSVTLPVGLADGKPQPLVLSGPAFSEAVLLRVARALERAVGFGALPPLP